MNGSKTKQNSARQVFSDYLKEHGLRSTEERFVVLGAAEEIPGAYFTTSQLLAVLNERIPKVSRATVYNTVDLLMKAGIVRGRRLGNTGIRYEFSGRNGNMNLVCSRCGKVKSLNDPAIGQLMGVRRYYAFRPEQWFVTVEGVCLACSRKEKAAAKQVINTAKIKKRKK